MLGFLKEYLLWARIHFYELTEYKKSFYLYVLNNLIYAFIEYAAAMYVVHRTNLIEPYKVVLVMLTSWLIFDFSRLFTYDKGFFMSDYFLFLARPARERLSTIINIWHRLTLIVIEIAVLAFVLNYYRISISFLQLIFYVILVILGAVVFIFLYNSFLVLGSMLFKSDNHGLKYMIINIQDLFLKYPYVLFENEKFIWSIAMMFMIPLYTYNPASVLWSFNLDRALNLVFISAVFSFLLYAVHQQVYRYFLKMFEVYGG